VNRIFCDDELLSLSHVTEMRNDIRDSSRAITSTDVDVNGVLHDDKD
jgi:hypothetical protein